MQCYKRIIRENGFHRKRLEVIDGGTVKMFTNTWKMFYALYLEKVWSFWIIIIGGKHI